METKNKTNTNLTVLKNSKTHSYLLFQNVAWEINKDGIKEIPYSGEAKIQRTPTLLENYPTFEKPFRVLKFTDKSLSFIDDFDFSLFLKLTGMPYDIDNFKKLSGRRKTEVYEELARKMAAIGYLSHGYFDIRCTKIIHFADGKEYKAGECEGRTGKSLTTEYISQYTTMVVLDGKSREVFNNDRFMFSGVTEKTDVICFDDIDWRLSINEVSKKAEGPIKSCRMYKESITLRKEDTPKFLVSSNGKIYSKANTYKITSAALHTVRFSPYFNIDNRPYQLRNRLFFKEWDAEQWNMSDNFIAACIHAYLKHGLI